jgi:uncharacterized membrane protein YbhN (UPF0104 family)
MIQVRLNRFQPYLRWVIFGVALLFLAKTLKDHWQEVVAIPVTATTWAGLVMALGVTLLAHIWSGWVWHWILAELGLSIGGLWTTSVYLKTNIAKYLPGNIWHFFGRVRSLQAAGARLETAIAGVLLEPVLMVAGALSLAALASWQLWILPLLGLGLVLVGVHPRWLNPLLKKLVQVRARTQGVAVEANPTQLLRYPLKPYLGELGFVLLRGIGFVLTMMALQPLAGGQILPVLGGFSLAWFMGMVVPGAPGGVGVFEAVAISLLRSQISPALLLSTVVFYRFISILAEAIGAGLIWIDSPGLALPPANPLLLPPAPLSEAPGVTLENHSAVPRESAALPATDPVQAQSPPAPLDPIKDTSPSNESS